MVVPGKPIPENGVSRYTVQRKTLNSLYGAINSLYGRLHCGGGTYFAHQQVRIPAFAEYSVYLYSVYENNSGKRYNITLQKKHYIAQLRQIIADEMETDDDVVDCGAGRKKELEGLVDDIDRLITDQFYLRQAQAFQYSIYDND